MSLLETAAEAVAPWYIAWPLRLLGGIKAGLAWVFATPLRIAIAVAVLLAVALAHEVSERHGDAARAAAQRGRLLAAFGQEQHAYGVLAGALATQNGAIRNWQLAGQIRHQLATRELRAAEQAGRPLIAAADQLDHAASAASTPPAVDCKTPANVLAQEGVL